MEASAIRDTQQIGQWSRVRFALTSAITVWSLYLAAALVRCIAYGFPQPFMLMQRHALTALVAMIMSWGVFRLLRRMEDIELRRRLSAALLLSAPPALILSVTNYNVMYVFAPNAVLRDIGRDMHVTLLGEVLHWSIENYFLFAGWAVLYTAVSHAVHTQELLRRVAASEAAARSAELRALRLQLDPHFLFNALNTISGLVLAGENHAADRTTDALSVFLRATLAADATADIPLADELHLQMLYLDVEQARFGDRLRVETSVPESLSHALVPALILQPIIENSIRHGVARSSRPVLIAVRAFSRKEELIIAIRNDGPDGSSGTGCGIGLTNVASRLALWHGGGARVEFGPVPGGGFETVLRMPLRLATWPRTLAA